jgi:hypothetical protein
MKKLIILTTSLLLVSGLSAGGWKKHKDKPIYDYVANNGNVLARTLYVKHRSQPTSYTCGSTVISMQLRWETYLKGKEINFDPQGIHNYINTTGGKESGLIAPELKEGQVKLKNYINDKYNLGLTVSMVEKKADTIDGAVDAIFKKIVKNNSPVILYGNTDTPVSGAGGHYYLGVGVINANNLKGLFINDSVYDSSAYPKGTILANQSIKPRQFLKSSELEAYWKETGSRWPWLTKHIYLQNSSI